MFDINEVIENALSYLESLEYSQSSIIHHKTSWNRFTKWLLHNGYEGLDREVLAKYFECERFNVKPVKQSRREEKTHVRRLLEISESGAISKPVCSKFKYKIPNDLISIYELYRGHLQDCKLKPITIRSYLCVIRNFLSECGAKTSEQLDTSALHKYLKAINTNAAQTKASKLYTVRDFIRFLYARGLCSPEIANTLPLIPGHKHSSVPSAYTSDELIRAFNSIDSVRCPLRNKAIFLLASVLGMRAGDIRTLKISAIDWRSRQLRFIQSKTNAEQVLPLPEPVLLSLADYIKNERPTSADEHVFITANAPYRSFEESSYVFHRSISRYFERAEVGTEGKHHGLHSLRHSAATAMLASHTSYPVIASVLGHSSSNVTRRYLSIDTENLRPLALEVPDAVND